MVDRIIVQAKSDEATPGSTHLRVTAARWVLAPLILAYCGTYLLKTQKKKEVTNRLYAQFLDLIDLHSELKYSDISIALVSLLALVASVFYCITQLLGSRRSQEVESTSNNKGVAITLYHAGVQLAMVSLSKGRSGDVIQQENPRLIPRDQIIDCIVTEVVLAHRVQTVVVFRLRKQPSDTQEKEACSIQLVNAFPGIDLSFMECCAIRSRVKSYLDLQ